MDAYTGSDAVTKWLTLTNLLLGAVVVLFVLLIALAALCEALSKLKRRRSYDAELNHDMGEMFGSGPPEGGPGILGRLCACMRQAGSAVSRFLQHNRHRHPNLL